MTTHSRLFKVTMVLNEWWVWLALKILIIPFDCDLRAWHLACSVHGHLWFANFSASISQTKWIWKLAEKTTTCSSKSPTSVNPPQASLHLQCTSQATHTPSHTISHQIATLQIPLCSHCITHAHLHWLLPTTTAIVFTCLLACLQGAWVLLLPAGFFSVFGCDSCAEIYGGRDESFLLFIFHTITSM